MEKINYIEVGDNKTEKYNNNSGYGSGYGSGSGSGDGYGDGSGDC